MPESYVHRIGRTARAGADGLAISFCNGEERAYLRDIERLTRQKVPVEPLPAGFEIPADVPDEPRPAPPSRRTAAAVRRAAPSRVAPVVRVGRRPPGARSRRDGRSSPAAARAARTRSRARARLGPRAIAPSARTATGAAPAARTGRRSAGSTAPTGPDVRTAPPLPGNGGARYRGPGLRSGMSSTARPTAQAAMPAG